MALIPMTEKEKAVVQERLAKAEEDLTAIQYRISSLRSELEKGLAYHTTQDEMDKMIKEIRDDLQKRKIAEEV